MPKGYWIAHVKANDDASFGSDSYAQYIAGARPAFEEFGAHFLARGGETVLAEGSDIGARHVVIEFESLELAKACYQSPAYQKAMKHRQAVSSATILLTEGV
ncbi:MAG: DUF1330 domain-containing protein [Pseudomonadota bacterium]